MTKTTGVYQLVDPDTGEHLGFRIYSKGWSWRRAPRVDAHEPLTPINPGETPTHPVDAATPAAIAEVRCAADPAPAEGAGEPRAAPYGLVYGLGEPAPASNPESTASIMWQLAARSARMGRGSL